MREDIKVLNNNKYNVGLLCHAWHKYRVVKPNSFIYLNEREVRELDSDYQFFSSGELVIDDEEMNLALGYSEKNPNTLTEAEIKTIFKLTPLKIKEKLGGVTELFAINKIYDVAKKSDLTALRLKAVEEIVGKEINLDDIDPEISEITDGEIIDLLNGNFMRMKSELKKYTDPDAIETIYGIAQKNVDNLAEGKIKFINDFCGKDLVIVESKQE